MLKRCLNFVLTGNVRAGTFPLHSLIASLPSVACHANLLHADERIRTHEWQTYFGHTVPLYTPQTISMSEYLDCFVFDNPRRNETKVGVRIPYSQLLDNELFSYLHGKTLEGDFCVLHIHRNPLACLISLMQAQQSGIWLARQKITEIPKSVYLEPELVTKFVRDSETARLKLLDSCDDILTFEYLDFFAYPDRVSRAVSAFLDLPAGSPGASLIRRLRNTVLEQRLNNFHAVLRSVPPDVRSIIESSPLF